VLVDHQGESDAELLTQIAGGSKQALAVMFDRHGQAVTRYAWALAASRMDVEEIVQDTFVTTWQKAATIVVPQSSALPWLLVTCRNHALNLVRKNRRHEADALPDDDGGTPSVTGATAPRTTATATATASAIADQAAAADARDTLRWVMAEIEQLEPLDRRICTLCLIEGRPYTEAAESLGLSVDAVKKRVSRARLRLRKGVADDAN
jgi:RNA polymerase sigma-70 factor (ECF subfamily)